MDVSIGPAAFVGAILTAAALAGAAIVLCTRACRGVDATDRAALMTDDLEESRCRSNHASPADYFYVGLASTSVGVGVVRYIATGRCDNSVFIATIMCFALGVLLRGHRLRRKEADRQMELDYYVPIVMERIVMCMESGLDIIPALQTIVDVEEKAVFAGVSHGLDPVTAICKRVVQQSEGGIAVATAIRDARAAAGNAAASFALIQLAVAYEQGGELVGPLRELSDATQAQYQDTIEEQIAKMPVKATLPLVVTFGGLMLSFLAVPLVQIVSFAGRSTFK